MQRERLVFLNANDLQDIRCYDWSWCAGNEPFEAMTGGCLFPFRAVGPSSRNCPRPKYLRALRRVRVSLGPERTARVAGYVVCGPVN